MTETFLQHHGWVLVSLLGGLLVTLMLLLGANIHLVNYHLGTLQKQAVLKATGRKWIFAFAALVVLGVTVYAAFPLFFRVAFWGARWLWALLLVTLFIQLIAYAICNKTEKPLGSTFFCIILMLNGALAPLLVGTFIGSFFTGAGFYVNRTVVPATATWVNPLHGLDLLTQPHALLLGLVAVALSYILGAMYVIRVVDDHPVRKVMRRSVRNMAVPFLLLAMVPPCPRRLLFLHQEEVSPERILAHGGRHHARGDGRILPRRFPWNGLLSVSHHPPELPDPPEQFRQFRDPAFAVLGLPAHPHLRHRPGLRLASGGPQEESHRS